jgi:hypothetical protein
LSRRGYSGDTGTGDHDGYGANSSPDAVSVDGSHWNADVISDTNSYRFTDPGDLRGPDWSVRVQQQRRHEHWN